VEEGPKIGPYQYRWRGPDFLPIEEMPGSILGLPNRQEAIRERLDSLHRRGLTELIDRSRAKKKSKYKKFKLIRKNKRV
jgi:hypothetical protein